ncbi:MAG: isoprenyl transferase [Phycisphaerales bacterium]
MPGRGSSADSLEHHTSLEQRRAAAADALGVPRERMPRHIAIIMDGNGRWAIERNQLRIAGHRRGAEVVKRVLTHAAKLGIEVLTLYSFSIENWSRPRDEVNALMQLAVEKLIGERETFTSNNISFKHIGRRAGLPADVLAQLDATIHATSHCTGTCLALALNYGSRAEIVDAVRAIAKKCVDGALACSSIDESVIESHLATAGMPDPDLLIRTAGEYRLSNYLLWQLSYAEIHVTERLWPDFSEEDFDAAIRDFASRDRRFGGV